MQYSGFILAAFSINNEKIGIWIILNASVTRFVNVLNRVRKYEGRNLSVGRSEFSWQPLRDIGTSSIAGGQLTTFRISISDRISASTTSFARMEMLCPVPISAKYVLSRKASTIANYKFLLTFKLYVPRF